MNRNSFNKMCQDTFHTIGLLNQTKGEEYARGDSYDTNSNFSRLARDLKTTKEQILWVYLAKHLDAIVCHINDLSEGKTRNYSEPIEGRIHDAINYLLLLKAMFIEGEENGRVVANLPGNVKKVVAAAPVFGSQYHSPRIVVHEGLHGRPEDVERDSHQCSSGETAADNGDAAIRIGPCQAHSRMEC